jgi:hypothetical protein
VTASPRQVLLFTGHMVDAPGRAVPRFPPDRVPAAAVAIAKVLDRLRAGPEDLALTQGAAGGDLLFAEACQARGVPLQLLLPQAEDRFVEDSVCASADGAAWADRYRSVRGRLAVAPRVLVPGDEASVYERANRWMLDEAVAHGVRRLRLLALWDGSGGDGPGGTRHMIDEVRRRHGQVFWIDLRQIQPLPDAN